MNICPVSVIIPSFNRQEYLSRAIRSVTRQTCPCSEIIVVDDGSTDNSRHVVQEAAAHSARNSIRYVYQANGGPAAARNTGIRESHAPMLAFLDSDDHWHRNKLAEQFSRMEEQPDFLISHTREKWLRRGLHLNQKKKHLPRHGDIFTQCLQLCAVGMSTVMVRRELFDQAGLFNESLPCCEDYDFWLRVSNRFPFLLIDQPLTIKEGGRTDQVSYIHRIGMDRYRIESLESLINNEQLSDTRYRLAVEEIERKIQIFAHGCMKHGKPDLGQRFLAKLTTIKKRKA